MNQNKNNFKVLLPILFAFFAMALVDMSGVITTHVKADFGLSDTMSKLLAVILFLWFFVLSIPVGQLMNKIGKRKTVVISLLATALAMCVPIISYTYPAMIVAVCLLGIGNCILQVSLNPLVTCVVSKEKLASTLTTGQFVKAIGGFLTPLLAGWMAQWAGNWLLIFPLYTAISVIATIWMYATKVDESQFGSTRTSSISDCFKLVATPAIFILFLGIFCNVGLDVGFNTTIPLIMQERFGISADAALKFNSIYFASRTIACFAGSFLLARFSSKKIFAISAAVLVVAIVGFFVGESRGVMIAAIILAGAGNSNVFSIIFSKALLYKPEKSNELSSIMIMGLIGGAVFPLIMGPLVDNVFGNQNGAVAVIAAGVAYLAFLAVKMKEDSEIERG
ncbi:MAG: MFS transporter [Bacteroidales bacterium]|nr:MFS transporter [Bacteroidales bacterium]